MVAVQVHDRLKAKFWFTTVRGFGITRSASAVRVVSDTDEPDVPIVMLLSPGR